MHVTVDKRFCGPPTSANGGYVCGVLADALGGPAEVTLRAPPPLGAVLELSVEAGAAALRHGETLVAEGKRGAWTFDAPEPPSFAEAIAATEHYAGKHEHPYPTCFVCGPQRALGDGLRLFPGALPGRAIVAAPWVPDASVVDATDCARAEIAWAALDCPGFFGMYAFAQNAPPLWLLGRLTASLTRRPRRDERCVVLGWLVGSEGRKAHVGSAIYGEAQDLCGVARGTWISVKAQ